MSTKYRTIYKNIIILSIIVLVLPNLSFGQEEVPAVPALHIPKSLEEAKELAKEAFKQSIARLPRIIEKLWRERVLPVWKKMYQIWSNFWDSYIQPWLESIWQRILGLLGQEIEKRKPQIEEELEKEKEELREEAYRTQRTLWERFKELFR